MTITGNYELFQYFHFETNFLKNKNLFHKLEHLFFSWRYQDWKHNIYTKTALPEATVKTNRMGSTKWTSKKNGVLSVTTFFWKFCFRARISYKELIWCNNYPNIYIHTFYKHWSFIWGCFVPVSVFFATNVFPVASKWANVACNTTFKKTRFKLSRTKIL